MARRPLQEINAGSMADIAFLLLIFFLVTTTMDQDIGILRQLPPPVPEDLDTPPVKKRNVYEVLVNSKNQLLVENERMDIRDLKEGAKM
ncbi:MAG TPA: biopolymer transporter ExbD, partial [Cryomorphaceae bacterium]|nr:biopolymer transporter ExbD [Cryomorphaceae bacterium]